MTDIDDPRTILSEMTEITERTIDRTFHRHADLDALYRDCPTAFWLAPNGDEALPPPLPGPPTAQIVVAADPRPDMIDPPAVTGMAGAIGRALIVAGPIFAATALALDQTPVDQHWWNPFARALATVFVIPLTAIVGAVLALLPVLIGVLALGGAGTRYPAVRRPLAWIAAGGLMGVAIAALFDAAGGAGIALVATSIACAAVARTGVSWTEPQPA